MRKREAGEESWEVDVSSIFGANLNHEFPLYWKLFPFTILSKISIRSSQEVKWTWSFMWEPWVWEVSYLCLFKTTMAVTIIFIHILLIFFLISTIGKLYLNVQGPTLSQCTFIYFKEIISLPEKDVRRDLKQATFSGEWGVSNNFTSL